jgi:hypothetical protein
MTASLTTTSHRPTSRLPSVPIAPRRRVWLLILSLMFVVVCAGAFALVYLRAETREQALGVARPVAAGQHLTVADLRVVRVSAGDGLRLVPASTASQVIGKTAMVPLAEGSLLTPGQVGPAAWPPADQAVVAVPVKSGRLASGVVAGVRVLVVPVTREDTSSEQVPSKAHQPISAKVVAVAEGADGGGVTVVSLLVARRDAVAVAGAAGDVSVAVAQG